MEWSLLGSLSRGYNQMLPPARKRGCLAENSPAPAAALGLISSLAPPAIPDPSLPPWARCVRVCMHAESPSHVQL